MSEHAIKPPFRTPQYRRIASVLRQQIMSGEYRPGSLLPGEFELAREFKVSRPTLRSALAVLAAEGLVVRRHGAGTLVNDRPFDRLLLDSGTSLTEDLIARGLVPGSVIVSIVTGRPSPDVRASLGLGARANVVTVTRVRTANAVAIGLQETSIPEKFCPGLAELELTSVSLSRLLRERYHLHPTGAELTIDAEAADERLAELIELSPGSPLLRTRRVSYLADDRAVERTDGWFVPALYRYRTSMGHRIRATPR